MHLMTPTEQWAWLRDNLGGLAVPIGAALAVLLAVTIWRIIRRQALASTLRAIALPLVLLWEAQGLYLLAHERMHANGLFSYGIAAVTSAMLLTLASAADVHHKRHRNLGPNGRRMWQLALVMGTLVALNATSLPEFAGRIVVPLLSVVGYVAPYLPDEPDGPRAGKPRQGAFRLTPRRLGVALGLLDPVDTDLSTVHRERHLRRLTLHAHGLHHGSRMTRGWHRGRLRRLTLLADDAMVAEVAARVSRVHHIETTTAPRDGRPVSRPRPVSSDRDETPRPAIRATRARVVVPSHAGAAIYTDEIFKVSERYEGWRDKLPTVAQIREVIAPGTTGNGKAGRVRLEMARIATEDAALATLTE